MPTLRHLPGTTERERAVQLARRPGGLTTRDAAAAGIHRQVLSLLVGEGVLVRVVRGIYRLPNHPVTEHHGLAMAAVAVPHGVICLFSALGFHGITTQLPSEVWMAIDRGARSPALRHPPLHIVRFTGLALTGGIEAHCIEGYTVRVYGVAKTVADCFKYRNKIGLAVALKALREGWRARRFTIDALDRYAEICRVAHVMRPYVEALVA
jgi:predicted transcriptional regulator of viral defense system